MIKKLVWEKFPIPSLENDRKNKIASKEFSIPQLNLGTSIKISLLVKIPTKNQMKERKFF